VSACRRFSVLVFKNPQFKSNAAVAKLCHYNTNSDAIRESDRFVVVALSLDYQPDGLTLRKIQHALVNQVAVYRSIKPGVIHHIVYMAVDVIVSPAGGDRVMVGKLIKPRRTGFLVHQNLYCELRRSVNNSATPKLQSSRNLQNGLSFCQ